MNNSFSLQQISRTSSLDANLISCQYKLNIMADFMSVKYEKPKMKHSEMAYQLGLSSSTLQRYRNDINMLSPYRINTNNTKKRTKRLQILILTTIHTTSPTSEDLKGPQLTLNQPRTNQLKIKKQIERWWKC